MEKIKISCGVPIAGKGLIGSRDWRVTGAVIVPVAAEGDRSFKAGSLSSLRNRKVTRKIICNGHCHI
jgi:hypothetical protein